MPELPDAELFKRVLTKNGLRRKIERIDLRDTKRLKNSRPKDLHNAFHRKTFGAARRHGKIVFAGRQTGQWLVMHFGMTGSLTAYDEADEESRFARLVFHFAGGRRLAFNNMRKFGWLELTDSPQEYLEREEIGPDALAVSRPSFHERIGSSGAMIKSALMNQKKIAGLGNVYSDEILFQTGIRPDAKAKQLSRERTDKVFDAMREVLQKTIELDADRTRMPDGWLAPIRTEQTQCPRCKGAIATKTVGGRTAYFCPECQS